MIVLYKLKQNLYFDTAFLYNYMIKNSQTKVSFMYQSKIEKYFQCVEDIKTLQSASHNNSNDVFLSIHIVFIFTSSLILSNLFSVYLGADFLFFILPIELLSFQLFFILFVVNFFISIFFLNYLKTTKDFTSGNEFFCSSMLTFLLTVMTLLPIIKVAIIFFLVLSILWQFSNDKYLFKSLFIMPKKINNRIDVLSNEKKKLLQSFSQDDDFLNELVSNQTLNKKNREILMNEILDFNESSTSIENKIKQLAIKNSNHKILQY